MTRRGRERVNTGGLSISCSMGFTEAFIFDCIPLVPGNLGIAAPRMQELSCHWCPRGITAARRKRAEVNDPSIHILILRIRTRAPWVSRHLYCHMGKSLHTEAWVSVDRKKSGSLLSRKSYLGA